MNATKLTTAAVIVLLCATPIVWQEQTIAAARREIAGLEASAPRSMDAPPKPPPIVRPNPDAVVMDIEQVAKDVEATGMLRGILSPDPAQATARLEALDVSTVPGLLDAVPSLSGGRERQQRVQMWLFKKLCKEDSLSGIRFAPEVLRDGGQETTVYMNLRDAFGTLIKEDPDAAIREFQALHESGGLEGKGTGGTSYIVYGHFVGALMAVRPAEAMELYASLDLGGRLNALGETTMIDSPEARQFLLGEIPKLEPRWQVSNYSRILASELNWRGLEGAASVFRDLQLPAEAAVQTLAGFLSDTNTGQARANLSIVERLDWLRAQVTPEQFAEAGGRFLGQTHEFRSEELQKHKNQHFRAYDWGAYRDQAIAAMFRPERPPDNAAEALSLAVEISDPSLRMETLRRLGRRFADRPTSYKAAVEAAQSLTPEEKTRVFQP